MTQKPIIFKTPAEVADDLVEAQLGAARTAREAQPAEPAAQKPGIFRTVADELRDLVKLLRREIAEKDEQIERMKNSTHDLELVNQTLRRRVESLEKDRGS